MDACSRDENVYRGIGPLGENSQSSGVELPQCGMSNSNTLSMVDAIEGAQRGVEGVSSEAMKRVEKRGDKVTSPDVTKLVKNLSVEQQDFFSLW